MKSFAPPGLGCRPEHGANTDAEIPRNAPDVNPISSGITDRHHLLAVCVLQAPTVKLSALFTRPSNPGQHALADHGAFELGKDATI